MELAQQSKVFLFSICFGFLAVLAFKILNFFATRFKYNKIILILSDVLFISICFIGAVCFLLTVGECKIEGYVLFGMTIGAIVFLLIFPYNKSRFYKKQAKK